MQRALLPDQRWHFQHGPIDLLLWAEGAPDVVGCCHEAAWQRFQTVLQELVAELPLLRRPIPAAPVEADQPRGLIAQRMWQACAPYRADYITPMAAVAGAVAQEIIACYQRPGIARAWVNNGGDIALHLTAGHSLRLGLFADLARWPEAAQGRLDCDAHWTLSANQPWRGVATSGWRGRSCSLGIADSVTVLADSAVQADAAATMIANAVNVSHPAILRQPAHSLHDDSDLGALLVTVDVPALPVEVVGQALEAGLARALRFQQQGLIGFAALFCQGQWRSTATRPRREGVISVQEACTA